MVSDFLTSNPTWINREGLESPLTLADILIIAPYNAQVFELQSRLAGARVGTVDKFQGQEAPLVIYSMTTSSHADAPRGMEFLYSLNRLNVATSRAQCLCVLVASPIPKKSGGVRVLGVPTVTDRIAQTAVWCSKQIVAHRNKCDWPTHIVGALNWPSESDRVDME